MTYPIYLSKYYWYSYKRRRGDGEFLISVQKGPLVPCIHAALSHSLELCVAKATSFLEKEDTYGKDN
jgi:hypothetical protein